jgi:hypothetical protein
MKHVFIVQHEHTLPGDRDDAKLIGAYSSEAHAQAAVERLRTAPGFRDTPAGFCISKYEIDQDNWVEGFVTMTPAVALPESQAELVRQLCQSNRGLRTLFEEHLQDQGELLPHVYCGDVTRYFVALVDHGTKDHEAEAVEILGVLEAAMSGDDQVRELIAVSFLENLLGSANLDKIKALLPPRLRTAFFRFYYQV